MTSAEPAVRALFDRATQAWTDGDAAAYADCFTPDADYVTFVGSHYRGHAAIEGCHIPLFTKFRKGSRLDAEITGLRFLSPDVALVHAKGAVVSGTKRRNRRNTKVQTYVAVRENGTWLFTAFQNTRYRPVMEAISVRLDARMAPSVPV
ncbi:MAG TPA: SgcJ/EcaC family oxidoreductase [Pseudonocardiaceae bacterium]|jgi:uncharacterized protein (TIGR02246 family)|nr:SgcJ/EcaC family oxidoreductase [Pseudonocardiaceae bacterium]